MRFRESDGRRTRQATGRFGGGTALGEQDGEVDLGVVDETGDPEFALQSADHKLQDLRAVSPEAKSAHSADEAGNGGELPQGVRMRCEATGNHVRFAGNAVAG